MQHPPEPLAGRDAITGWRCRRQRQDQALVEPLVIPFVVVVRDELADGATPRALADQDQALEAGCLDGAPEARRVGVQVGARAGRRMGVTSAGGACRARPAEERVAVMMRTRMCRRHPSAAAGACRMRWGTHGRRARR